MPSPWFVELRAILVALHLVAIVAMALPAPVGGLGPSTRDAPGIRALFADASDLTGLSEEALSDATFAFLTKWLEIRGAVLRPFRPYYTWCGTRQGWRMMAVVNRRPARLRIELDGALAYRTGDPDARWYADVLEASRTRGVMFEWSWKASKTSYEDFMAWLALRAKEERGPDTRFVACLERIAPGLPGEADEILGCSWTVER